MPLRWLGAGPGAQALARQIGNHFANAAALTLGPGPGNGKNVVVDAQLVRTAGSLGDIKHHASWIKEGSTHCWAAPVGQTVWVAGSAAAQVG